jgi:O-antigen/teichoic acid export membrane protein
VRPKPCSRYEVISSFFKNKFIKDTSTLVLGTGIAHIINLSLLPILSRLYNAEQFGIFSLYMVLISVISVIACLGYEPAIIIPQEPQKAMDVLLGSIIICCFMGGLSLFIVLIFGHKITILMKAPRLYGLLFWIPLNILVIGVYQVLVYWNIRNQQFKKISISRSLQAGVTNAGQIGGSIAGGGENSLVYGQILGQIISATVLAKNVIHPKTAFFGKKQLNISRIFPVMIEYKNFPLFSTWGTLMNVAASQNVPLILNVLFGTSITGFYFMAIRLIGAPMALIGSALGQVLIQRASTELNNTGNISSLVVKAISRSILFWAPLFFLMMIAAPKVFEIYLGPQWITSGRYVQALIPVFFFQIITSPVSVVLIVLQKQKIIALLQALLLFGSVVSLGFAAWLSKGPMTSIIIYSFSLSTVYLIYLAVIIRCSEASFLNIKKELISTFRIAGRVSK